MPQLGSAPVGDGGPQVFFDETFRDLPPPQHNLGNFAEQLTTLGETPAPEVGRINLGDFSSQLDPEKKKSNYNLAETGTKVLGDALTSAAEAMLLGQDSPASQSKRPRLALGPKKRFMLSRYLSGLDSNPGRAKL